MSEFLYDELYDAVKDELSGHGHYKYADYIPACICGWKCLGDFPIETYDMHLTDMVTKAFRSLIPRANREFAVSLHTDLTEQQVYHEKMSKIRKEEGELRQAYYHSAKGKAFGQAAAMAISKGGSTSDGREGITHIQAT